MKDFFTFLCEHLDHVCAGNGHILITVTRLDKQRRLLSNNVSYINKLFNETHTRIHKKLIKKKHYILEIKTKLQKPKRTIFNSG